jgi:hypothetical protein
MKRFDKIVDTELTKTSIMMEDGGPLSSDDDFDPVSFVMAYENGELDQDDIVAGFQKMLDSGLINSLQGSYQRTAQQLLDAGLIHENDSSVEIKSAFSGVMSDINNADSVSSFIDAVNHFTNFKERFAPVPDDMQLAWKKVLTAKAQELNVLPTLAASDDADWQNLIPYLGSIAGISGTSNPES